MAGCILESYTLCEQSATALVKQNSRMKMPKVFDSTYRAICLFQMLSCVMSAIPKYVK